MEKPNLTCAVTGEKVPFVLSKEGESNVIQVPGTISQYLRDYQRNGIQFLYDHYVNGVGAILADDMGLGKTIQVIALIAAILRKTGHINDIEKCRPNFIKRMEKSAKGINENDESEPFLIICPASVLYNWVEEFETWGYFSIGKYHKQYKAETMLDLKHGKLDAVITTYETCRDNINELMSINWNAVFADEVHKIKAANSELTIALKKLTCQRRYGLTGTPLQNKLAELWCILDWANPDCFGHFSSFHKNFVVLIENGQKQDVTKRQLAEARRAQQLLVRAHSKFMLRRTKDLIADQLPRKDDLVIYCQPTDLQEEIYRTILEQEDMKFILRQNKECSCGSGKRALRCHFKKSPSGIPVRSLTMIFMHLLLKAANHIALLLPSLSSSAKQTFAKEICSHVFTRHSQLMEMGQADAFHTLSDAKYCGKMKVLQGLLNVFHKEKSKVLLFSYSTKLLDILESYVMSMGYEYRRLDGSTPSLTRVLLVQEFNREPNIFIFLISTKAGGIGLNLTGANVVIIYDPNWNPAHDLQAQDRAYRLGQRQDVRVFRLICSGTIEENIYLRQVFKQQIGNVAVEKKNCKRLFCGVSLRDKRMRDELFGMENLFQFRTGDSCLTEDILLRNDKIESELKGFRIGKYVALDKQAKNLSNNQSNDDSNSDSDESGFGFDSFDDSLSENASCSSDVTFSSKKRKKHFSSVDLDAVEDYKDEKMKNMKSNEATISASLQSVSDVLEKYNVVHVHNNKSLIRGSRVDDHITNCALQDVFELNQNTQQPAVFCEPITSSSCETSESESGKIFLKSREMKTRSRCKTSLKRSRTSKNKDSGFRVIGKTNILTGCTPIAIRRQQFRQLAVSLGAVSEIDLAHLVIENSNLERSHMLRDFYLSQNSELESLFEEKSSNLSSRVKIFSEKSESSGRMTDNEERKKYVRSAAMDERCNKEILGKINNSKKKEKFTGLMKKTMTFINGERQTVSHENHNIMNCLKLNENFSNDYEKVKTQTEQLSSNPNASNKSVVNIQEREEAKEANSSNGMMLDNFLNIRTSISTSNTQLHLTKSRKPNSIVTSSNLLLDDIFF